MNKIRAMGVLAIASSMIGCSGYDRDYAATYDVTSHRGAAEVSITPGDGRRTFTGRVSKEIDWAQANRDLPTVFRN